MKSKKGIRILSIICVLVMLCTAMPANVYASAANQKAMKIYRNFLAKKSVTYTSEYGNTYKLNLNWFYVINIDKKGVPELIVTNEGGGITGYHVYTVKNNKIKYLGEYGARGISLNPPTFSYSSKYKGLVATGWTNFIGGYWMNMYKISGSKLVHRKHVMEQDASRTSSKRVYYYGTTDDSRKKVSKSAYKKYCKKYFTDYKTYKMKKNTASNRSKLK